MANETTYRPTTDEHLAAVARAEAALLDPAVSHMVEMVIRTDGDAYEAASVDGRVRFTAHDRGNGWAAEVVTVEGENPLSRQAPDHFATLDEERATPYPVRAANAYPFAYDQVIQLFDAPAAPDLVAIHTAAHNWEDQGGHRGEHGSLDIVQSRGPFILAGPGVRSDGLRAEACRVVDIAPTVMALLGTEPCGGVAANGSRRDDALLARQDGEVLAALLSGDDRPDHVIGFLLDGCNANVLYDLVARGEAPNIARLMAMGTSLAHGAMSSLPTVTLANHTAILTGCYPGHHGILHNAWWDRVRGEQIITNSPMHWPTAMDHLDAGVETLYSAIRRAFPGEPVVAVNEPCDTGADHSVFDTFRTGSGIPELPRDDEVLDVTRRFVRPGKDYDLATKIDHLAVEQFLGIWSGHYKGVDWAVPRFTWVNFSLTDAAFHEGGPYSEVATASVHDTDARIGRVLEAVERAGVFDRTAFFLTADHGMEESDPTCTGNWAEALDDCGVAYRDEGYSFIYVNP
jgi:hypothetical protein